MIDLVADLKGKYPNHVVLVEQTFFDIKDGTNKRFYCAYDEDADVVHEVLGYRLVHTVSGRRCCGPNLHKIRHALLKKGYAVVTYSNNQISSVMKPEDLESPWSLREKK